MKQILAIALATFIAIAALSSVYPLKVSAATANLYPTDDAFTESLYPDSNYGALIYLDVGYNATSDSIKKTYLKFDLTAYNLTAITQATLRIHAYLLTADFDADIYKCGSDAWTEDTITWNNAPEAITFIDGFHIGFAPYWYEIDITDTVKAETDKKLSLVIQNASYLGSAVARFYSSEQTGIPNLKPYLLIEYTEPPPPPPPGEGGTWTVTGISGIWNYFTNPLLLSATGWNEGRINLTRGYLNKTFADGEGFQINFTVSIKGDRKEWWWWEGTKRFYFSFGLHGTDDAAFSLFYIAHEQGIIMKTSEAKVGNQLQYNVGKPFPSMAIGETVDTTNALWHIQFIRLSSTTMKIIYAVSDFAFGPEETEEVYGELMEGAIKTFNETLTVDPSVWSNPELVLYVGHEGSGEFQVVYGDLYIGAITGLEDQTPPALGNPFQWIIDGFDFLYSLVVILGALVQGFIPILPFIFLFYILDIVITAFQTGRILLIGDFVLKMFDYLRRIWDTLVNFGKLIWDAITFWT